MSAVSKRFTPASRQRSTCLRASPSPTLPAASNPARPPKPIVPSARVDTSGPDSPRVRRSITRRLLAHREAAARHGRRLHDRRGGLPVGHEAVDDLLEVVDVAKVELHEEAVLAGDAMALGHLRR